MTPINGDLASLSLKEFGSVDGVKLVGCTTGDSITFNTEFIETTGVTAAFVESVPTYKSGEISSDTVLIMTDTGDPQHASTQLAEWQKAGTKLYFEWAWSTKKITGAAYISALSINAPAQDFANVTISLNITGEWDLDF